MNDVILNISGVLVALVLLLLLAVAATWVGGIGIRHDFSAAIVTPLDFSSPLVRGLPATIRWQAAPGKAVGDVVAIWHDAHGEYLVGEGAFDAGVVVVAIPCDSAVGNGSLVLKDRVTQQVLGQTTAELLPAGADCAL